MGLEKSVQVREKNQDKSERNSFRLASGGEILAGHGFERSKDSCELPNNLFNIN